MSTDLQMVYARLDDHDTLACKNIWCAVLLQAIDDLFETRRIGSEQTVEQLRNEAGNFLFGEDSDPIFRLMGVDPDSARVALLKKIQAQP